jgi:glycosyltransferase involved in cell wall biosynthesis
MDRFKRNIKQNNKVESEMNWPKVTICVPVRNGARTIRRTLDSILAQDYPNFEVIVSDNYSDDDTASIVQEYAEQDVQYYFNSKLEEWGESNWNHILSLAKGPFIALYHADDLYTPTMVSRQVEFLQAHADVSSVFTMSRTIDEQGRPTRLGDFKLPEEYQGQDIFSFHDLFNAALKYSTITIVPTMMTRKNVLDKVGNFNWQQFCSAADIDLYLRMAQICPIGIIDEPLHRYRISAQQGTIQINKARTHLAHFFQVIDHYLTLTEVSKLVNQEALKIYKMYRSADQVYCAINFVLQGKKTEALNLLDEAICCGVFLPAYHRPRQLMRIVFGAVLKASLRLGIGKIISQIGDIAYNRYRVMRCKPIKSHIPPDSVL